MTTIGDILVVLTICIGTIVFLYESYQQFCDTIEDTRPEALVTVHQPKWNIVVQMLVKLNEATFDYATFRPVLRLLLMQIPLSNVSDDNRMRDSFIIQRIRTAETEPNNKVGFLEEKYG
jgi:hypothetical protein